LTDLLKWRPMPNKMREFTLRHNVQRHLSKLEDWIFEYHWLRALAMFDVTSFLAILSGIGRHFKFCRYVKWQTVCWSIWNGVWSDKRREVTLHHYLCFKSFSRLTLLFLSLPCSLDQHHHYCEWNLTKLCSHENITKLNCFRLHAALYLFTTLFISSPFRNVSSIFSNGYSSISVIALKIKLCMFLQLF